MACTAEVHHTWIAKATHHLAHLQADDLMDTTGPVDLATLRVWREPYTDLRISLLLTLRTEPFARTNLTSSTYEDRFIDHAYVMGPSIFRVKDMANR